ncbi:MAG: hypothetical protein C0490_24510, partial [Marivirga sp.]|nr:hypothetical protein [Marivirga sp.]
MITEEDQTLTSCLTRSLKLSDSIYAEIYTFEHKNLIKDVLTKSLAGISLEHANSIMILMGQRNYTTATALLRLQFEAVTRSMWIHFAAKNEYMDKYAGRIDVNKLPPGLPTVTAMIEEILKCPVKGPGEMLRDFKE